MPIIKIPKT